MTLAISADAEKLDDSALNREVDPLVEAYLVWARTRRPASFHPRGCSERDELAQAFWQKAPQTQRADQSQGGKAPEARQVNPNWIMSNFAAHSSSVKGLWPHNLACWGCAGVYLKRVEVT